MYVAFCHCIRSFNGGNFLKYRLILQRVNFPTALIQTVAPPGKRHAARPAECMFLRLLSLPLTPHKQHHPQHTSHRIFSIFIRLPVFASMRSTDRQTDKMRTLVAIWYDDNSQ